MEVQLKSRTFNNCDACNWVWSFSLAFMPQFLHCGYIRQVKSEEEEGGGKGCAGSVRHVWAVSQSVTDTLIECCSELSPGAQMRCQRSLNWLADWMTLSIERKNAQKLCGNNLKHFQNGTSTEHVLNSGRGQGVEGLACKILAWWHVAHVAAVKEFLLWIFQAACYERAQHIHNAGGNV